MYLKTKKKKFNLKTSPLIVGILNLTPDSFYDGNKYISKYKMLKRVEEMINEGADIIDVSAGQTSVDAKPVYGRMFQTPFSDRIRNEAKIQTMAVGNIYEADHVNSILMAGRADLVCLARPHLSNPYWTLHTAAANGDREMRWPLPYEAGRDQLWRLADRAKESA